MRKGLIFVGVLCIVLFLAGCSSCPECPVQKDCPVCKTCPPCNCPSCNCPTTDCNVDCETPTCPECQECSDEIVVEQTPTPDIVFNNLTNVSYNGTD